MPLAKPGRIVWRWASHNNTLQEPASQHLDVNEKNKHHTSMQASQTLCKKQIHKRNIVYPGMEILLQGIIETFQSQLQPHSNN